MLFSSKNSCGFSTIFLINYLLPLKVRHKNYLMSTASYIRIHKNKILLRWEKVSRELIDPANDKSRSEIRDHLPELIDALCDVVERGVFEKPQELGEIHGRQRFSFGDYTLSEVLNEYWLLKRVLIEELEQFEQIYIKEFSLISRFFESAATVAAVEFAELREAELNQSSKNLEASNNDLERFAAVAAHDLKSPTATIIGYADLILQNSLIPEEEISKVDTIKRIGTRMIELVDHLLDYSRIGKSNAKKEVFSLSKSAIEAKANLFELNSTQKYEVRISVLPDFNGYEPLFTQLFQNLIENSLKFKSDIRPCLITISGSEEDDQIKISFKDNGMGFDSSLNFEVFEPFKRGDNIKNIHGSGLGLATVQKIVELHGGKISAHGQKGEGVEFIIKLPRELEKH